MIKIENLSKIYNSKRDAVVALSEVSLSIKSGEFVSIVGPSGSGKTTLLLCMGGLIHPSRGKVTIGEDSIYDLDVKKRAIFRLRNLGFVFQTFNLIPYLTALENVQIPLALAGISDGHQSGRAAELLEKMGLADRLNHKPRELSIGQQQRVAIARALANDPKIILADEPTGNLDPDLSLDIMNLFREINAAGTTVLVATHDRELVRHVGRRAIMLDHGRVVESA